MFKTSKANFRGLLQLRLGEGPPLLLHPCRAQSQRCEYQNIGTCKTTEEDWTPNTSTGRTEDDHDIPRAVAESPANQSLRILLWHSFPPDVMWKHLRRLLLWQMRARLLGLGFNHVLACLLESVSERHTQMTHGVFRPWFQNLWVLLALKTGSRASVGGIMISRQQSLELRRKAVNGLKKLYVRRQ